MLLFMNASMNDELSLRPNRAKAAAVGPEKTSLMTEAGIGICSGTVVAKAAAVGPEAGLAGSHRLRN